VLKAGDRHLTEDELDLLAGLPGSDDSSSTQAIKLNKDVIGHLSECTDCRTQLDARTAVNGKLVSLKAIAFEIRGEHCPSDEERMTVAAGLGSAGISERMLDHIAHCDHCGPILREITEDFADSVNLKEQTILDSLQSTSKGWQSRLARQLAGKSKERSDYSATSNHWLRNFVRIPRFVAFSFALAIIITGVWVSVKVLRPHTADELLADAYMERRTLEVRISGAKYAPMRVERGSGRSDVEKPTSLLKAESVISENLRKFPDDPTWLDAKGRADLLDGNYESAIASLRHALEVNPSSTSILTDLGSAYFLRADTLVRSADYGNAIESFSKALAKSPNDTIALFNRALACERMFLYDQSVDDWQHYLRLDSTGEWAADARSNLQRVEQILRDKKQQSAVPLLSPREFDQVPDTDSKVGGFLDLRIERYLEAAVQSWLAQRYVDSKAFKSATEDALLGLESLSAILKKHHDDAWLTDFLKSAPSSIQLEALRSLLASNSALNIGEYNRSGDLARKSIRGFEHSRNVAGQARATFALLLAQSFALDSGACLKTADSMIPVLSANHYRWLQAQFLIQKGQCLDAQAREEEAIDVTTEGGEVAHRARFPSVELRAVAFRASYERDLVSADQGLLDITHGLATFWKSDVADGRGENLYSVLFDVTGTRNWHYVETFALKEKIEDFPVNDQVERAAELQLLAAAEAKTGEFEVARTTLRDAGIQLARLPKDEGVTFRKAEFALEDAGIQSHIGNARQALDILNGLQTQFEATDDALLQGEYFKIWGETYLALGMTGPAEGVLGRALSITENGLMGLRSEADKLQWSRMEGDIYRDLLQIKLISDTPAAALEMWEWYKGASLHSHSAGASSTLIGGSPHSIVPPKLATYELPAGTALISYVLLKHSAVVFVLRDEQVRTHELQLTEGTELTAADFLSLVDNPTADMNFVGRESRRLYEILVAPLESDINGVTSLRFEPDGELNRIPFDLLQNEKGLYLLDRFKVSYSPGLAYRPSRPQSSITPSSAALIVVAVGGQDNIALSLPDAAEEGKDVAAHFDAPTVLVGSLTTREKIFRKLSDVEVFHFVGHAVASVERVGLLLGANGAVSSKDLARIRPRNLRLVVLSACDTANGENGTLDDVTSVARTLAVAGVPQTIASRWKVDSVVTRQLMNEFYTNLMVGKTSEDALRLAATRVRSMPEYRHPYYWGAFAVVSNF
jgi:CHAT domain-containing protein/tetratricopeptide (TPR) repeat protein